MEEPILPRPRRGEGRSQKIKSQPVSLGALKPIGVERLVSFFPEFDRVLGGGIVPGSVILVAGDPGIGKSTLMLQVGARIAEKGTPVLYVSGEESTHQLKLRADRLGLGGGKMLVLAETDLGAIHQCLEDNQVQLAVIDSIQAIYDSGLESAPGSISQVRECAASLLNLAKEKDLSLFLIGHVTKEGAIAGPRVLEHLVDTVLYFEGDRHQSLRILRTFKNRFGSTDEIGVFDMREEGLVELKNPSQVFLSERSVDIPGTAIVPCLKGTRPLLVEVQALVTRGHFGYPQRAAMGIDPKKLALLIAVLERRLGLALGDQDVFINVAGGVRIDEPAVDLGISLAIASSLKGKPVDSNMSLVGEVGLGGEVRGVGQIEKRIVEAEKLGFKRMLIPKANLKGLKKFSIIGVSGIKDLREAMERAIKR